MAWGAAATGTPSATGSTGQGLSLMQESLAEIALAADPARGAQHGARAGRLLAGHPRPRPRRLRACRSSRRWTCPRRSRWRSSRSTSRSGGATRCCCSATTTSRTPSQSVDADAARPRAASRPTTGRSTGPPAAPARPGSCRRSAPPSSSDDGGYDLAEHYAACARAHRGDAGRHRTAGRDRLLRRRRRRRGRVRHARRSTSAPRSPASAGRGARVGFVRPITLLPVPERRHRPAPPTAPRAVAVYENNQGQMVDDVRLAVLGARPVAVHRRPQPRRLRLRHRPRPRRRLPACDRRSQRSAAMSADRFPPRDRCRRPDRRAAHRAGARLVDDFTPDAPRRRRAQPVPRLRRAHRDARRSLEAIEEHRRGARAPSA